MAGCYIPIPVVCAECDKAPYIGENGNWWVGDKDTGVQAQGPAGIDGDPGKNGFISVMDVLFDGQADTEGKTYLLSTDITGYKFLFVEYKLHRKDGMQANYYGWIGSPQVSPTQLYGNTFQVTVAQNRGWTVHMYFVFTQSNAFIIKNLLCEDVQNAFDYLSIAKIYGIK